MTLFEYAIAEYAKKFPNDKGEIYDLVFDIIRYYESVIEVNHKNEINYLFNSLYPKLVNENDI